MKTKENLKKWFKRYLVNKDLLEKKIKAIKEIKEGLIVEYKNNSELIFFVIPIIKSKEEVLKNLEKGNGFVFLVNKKNIDFLINNFKILKNYKKITFYFVDEKRNKVIAIKPYFHHLVCDNKNLSKGLKTIFMKE